MAVIPTETQQQAAVRAAAEALGVPAVVAKTTEPMFGRGLQKSNRDAEIKDYRYHVVPVEPHPDFAHQFSPRSAIHLVRHRRIKNGRYHPVSGSVEDILRNAVEWGWN